MTEKDFPDWCYLGGSFRFDGIDATPTNWTHKASGQWQRKEMIPYGNVDADYREKYFVCAECCGLLQPHQNNAYHFYCSGCYRIWRWGFGGLWGYGSNHAEAEYLEED